MAFLSPLFLAAAAAAAVPVVLHLLKRHTEPRVQFPAVALLKGAPVEHIARRRLRDLLLLALRVSALVLLALAFARPFFPTAAATASRLTVVAVDTSLSMSAPSTLAKARQLAAAALRDAPAGHDVAVVSFADRADVVIQPTSDRNAAAAGVTNLSWGFGATSYAAGLAAAGALFRGRSGTIVVVTDLQSSGWDAGSRAAVPEHVRVDVKDADPPAVNLAVESLQAEGDRVVAGIHNTGIRARDAQVRLTVDGREAGRTSVRVEARGVAAAVFTGVRASGIAAATVDDPAGIPGDNSRYAFFDRDAPVSTLIATTTGDLEKEAWYLRHALPGARGIPAVEIGRLSADVMQQDGTILLLSTRGLERRGREQLAAYVSAGGGVMIAAGPDVDSDVVAEVLGASERIEMKAATPQKPLTLAPADVRHPIFRAFGAEIASLGLVQFRTVARVSGRSCQTIARFSSGDAAALDCAAGKGRAIVFASDLNGRWNDFPVHASFVPFLDQAARYLANAANRGSEYLVGEVPAGVAPVPGPASATLNGITRRVIVNVDPRELSGDRMSPADFEAAISRMKDELAEDVRVDRAEQENRQHLWQYLLWAMILAVAAEGIVAARAA